MTGRYLRPLRDVIERLIHDPRRRLAATAILWVAVLGVLIVVADRVVWLGVALGLG